jgi:hypothetical protein
VNAGEVQSTYSRNYCTDRSSCKIILCSTYSEYYYSDTIITVTAVYYSEYCATRVLCSSSKYVLYYSTVLNLYLLGVVL